MHNTLLYSFEGLDGAGKTTNVTQLHTGLTENGYEVAAVTSPSKSVLGKFIRAKMQEFSPELKEDLFLLDIQETLQTIPRSVHVLLFDRYVDSLYSSNLESERATIEAKARDLPRPYRTFLLSIPPDVAWEREGAVSDHPLDMDWLQLKYARYQELVTVEPERFYVVDATVPQELVFRELFGVILDDLIQLNELEVS